jgi:hypothetical protein
MAKSNRRGGGPGRRNSGAAGEIGRTRDGRFKAGGPSPNPRGRPPKRRAEINEVLQDVLETEVPLNNGERRRSMPMKEALTRTLCAHAMKDARIALALFRFVVESERAKRPTEVDEPAEVDDAAVLSRFLSRELRRQQHTPQREPEYETDDEAASGANAGEGDDDE